MKVAYSYPGGAARGSEEAGNKFKLSSSFPHLLKPAKRTPAMGATLLKVVALLLLSGTAVASKCPERCRCLHDDLGRKAVHCEAAELGNTIPVFDMERDIKILTITSEDEQPNVVTVGPIFSPLPQLEEVHITRANVPAIGDNSFWGLRHLRLLNLTYNNITFLLDSHFRGIRSLKALHLDNNNIDTIASATFMPLENLEVLTLSNNNLRSLSPRIFYLLSELKVLDLSGNRIKEIDPGILADVPGLRTLRCARCELTHIRSAAYKAIPDLEVLDLRDNEISSLAPEEYTDLKYIKRIYLDGNEIFELKDYTFKDLGLFDLSLSRNLMERVSRMAFEESSIMALDLSSNKLSFSSLRHLNPIIMHIQNLNIGSNHLSVQHLQDLLKHAIRLKQLNISNLKLTHLPPNLFSYQSKLEALNVSMNNLRFIPVDILLSLPHLKSLDLRHNHIRGLPDVILRRLDRIDDIHLQHNPWSCDQCHIPQLKLWLNKTAAFRDACKPNIDAPNCLKCQSPLEMYDKPIIEVEGLQLQPCPEGTFDVAAASASSSGFSLVLAILTSSVVLVLLVVILVVGIVMYNKHSAFYYTHENDNHHHFYDNPAVTSNHTDVTVEEDLDHLQDSESENETRARKVRETKGPGVPNVEEDAARKAEAKEDKTKGTAIKFGKKGKRQGGTSETRS